MYFILLRKYICQRIVDRCLYCTKNSITGSNRGVFINIVFYRQTQSSSLIRKGIAANFFKATFSSRSKAVPAASSYSVQETNKIGSAETKPVTRNRPRTGNYVNV